MVSIMGKDKQVQWGEGRKECCLSHIRGKAEIFSSKTTSQQ